MKPICLRTSPSRASTSRPNRRARPSVTGEEARQHLHGGRLAAAVRAEEAEDLAALDAEVHVVHGHEVAEAAGQALGLDDGLATRALARRHVQLAVPAARLLGQQRDEGRVEVARRGALLQLRRSAGCQDAAGVHRGEPAEDLGLLHVGGRHHHGHAGPTLADAVDELPELTPREWIHPRSRLVEH